MEKKTEEFLKLMSNRPLPGFATLAKNRCWGKGEKGGEKGGGWGVYNGRYMSISPATTGHMARVTHSVSTGAVTPVDLRTEDPRPSVAGWISSLSPHDLGIINSSCSFHYSL